MAERGTDAQWHFDRWLLVSMDTVGSSLWRRRQRGEFSLQSLPILDIKHTFRQTYTSLISEVLDVLIISKLFHEQTSWVCPYSKEAKCSTNHVWRHTPGITSARVVASAHWMTRVLQLIRTSPHIQAVEALLIGKSLKGGLSFLVE